MMASYLLVIVIIAALCAFVAHRGFDWDEIWSALVFVTVCALGGYLSYLQEMVTL